MKILSRLGRPYRQKTNIRFTLETEKKSQSHMTFDDDRQLYVIQAIVDGKLMDIQFTEVL